MPRLELELAGYVNRIDDYIYYIEYSARYNLEGWQPDDQPAIAWPNVFHAEEPSFDGPASAQFVELSDGSHQPLFHCDHVYFHPKREGREEIRFLLWHIDHADDSSDPLEIEVFAADE